MKRNRYVYRRSSIDDREIRQIYSGSDDQPLTPEQIKELINLGIPELDVRWMAKMGYSYDRAKESLTGSDIVIDTDA